MYEISLLDQQGYYQQVWDLVRQVPYGKVATYGQIAQSLPLPQGIGADDYKAYGARWVGNAMAACPDDVPWQRVLNSQGTISQRVGADKQKLLLEQEGILFVANRLDLQLYQWPGLGQPDNPVQAQLF